MDNLREVKRKVLRRLLPESILKEIRCFVLYDQHPMDERQLDITICTKYELQEYYQRELKSSIQINNAFKLEILRNLKCELFYLVYSNKDIIILSSKKQHISILRTVTSVNSVTIDDSECTGQPILKITQEDEALPLVFDNNFEIVNSRLTLREPESEESQSIVNQLRNKLTEARYTTKCNEKTYKEYVKLRQLAAFSIYYKTCADTRDCDVNLNLNLISSALKVNIQVPIVKLCNKKVVVILKIFNRNSKSMEDVHVLLHGTSLPSITYTTKLFQTSECYYFKETDTQIRSNTESMVIAIVDLEELKYNITSRLDFDIVVSYKLNNEFYLLPFESVSISAMDTMGTDFDTLASEKDFSKIVLAVLATSYKVDLQLSCVQTPSGEDTFTFLTIFHKYLNMKLHSTFDNVVIHNESPFHVLHGVMVVLITQNQVMNVEVYTRDPSQALALIHYMNDKVPYRVIAITSDVKIKPKPHLMNHTSNHNEHDTKNIDYSEFGLSMIKQIKLIRQYLFDCIEKMNEEGSINNNRINYMALGKPKYLEFRQQVLTELQVLSVSGALV